MAAEGARNANAGLRAAGDLLDAYVSIAQVCCVRILKGRV